MVVVDVSDCCDLWKAFSAQAKLATLHCDYQRACDSGKLEAQNQVQLEQTKNNTKKVMDSYHSIYTTKKLADGSLVCSCCGCWCCCFGRCCSNWLLLVILWLQLHVVGALVVAAVVRVFVAVGGPVDSTTLKALIKEATDEAIEW